MLGFWRRGKGCGVFGVVCGVDSTEGCKDEIIPMRILGDGK